MSKTNHQRGYKSTYSPKHFERKYIVGGSIQMSILADRTISACATLGDAHTLSAKKRFHENAATRKIAVKEE